MTPALLTRLPLAGLRVVHTSGVTPARWPRSPRRQGWAGRGLSPDEALDRPLLCLRRLVAAALRAEAEGASSGVMAGEGCRRAGRVAVLDRQGGMPQRQTRA